MLEERAARYSCTGLAGLRGVRPLAGFFSRACAGAPLPVGGGVGRVRGGRNPANPQRTSPQDLWARSHCLTWSGGEGRVPDGHA
jgi:hypothetical protein